MSDEANIQRVLDYLRQHRNSYSLEVLRQQLLAAGYNPSDVQAAFARLDAPDAATGAAPTLAVSDSAAAGPPADQPLLPQSDEPPAAPVAADPPADQSPVLSTAADDTPPSAAANNADERMVAQMTAYLRQYGDQYDIEALRQQLLASGQRPALVEQALLQAKVTGPRESAVWPLGLLVMVINLVVISTFSGSLASLGGSSSEAYLAAAGLIPSLILIGELVAGLILLRGPRQRLGKIVLWGLLFTFVLPIIAVLLLVGICLVIIFGTGAFGI